jgi:hypothetical protein
MIFFTPVLHFMIILSFISLSKSTQYKIIQKSNKIWSLFPVTLNACYVNQKCGGFSPSRSYSHFHVINIMFTGACELSCMCWQATGAPRQVVGSR